MHPSSLKNSIEYSQALRIKRYIQQQMNSTNIKIKYVIHLLKLDLCNVQYVGKSETAFNICLNSLRKDVKDPNTLSADKHFTLPGHDVCVCVYVFAI